MRGDTNTAGIRGPNWEKSNNTSPKPSIFVLISTGLREWMLGGATWSLHICLLSDRKRKKKNKLVQQDGDVRVLPVATMFIIQDNEKRLFPMSAIAKCLVNACNQGFSSPQIMGRVLRKSCIVSIWIRWGIGRMLRRYLVVRIQLINGVIKHSGLYETVVRKDLLLQVHLELFKWRKMAVEVDITENVREGKTRWHIVEIHFPIPLCCT